MLLPFGNTSCISLMWTVIVQQNDGMCACSSSRNTCPTQSKPQKGTWPQASRPSHLFSLGCRLEPPSGSLPLIFLPPLSLSNLSTYLIICVVCRGYRASRRVWIPSIQWCQIQLTCRRAISSCLQRAMWLSNVFLPASCLTHKCHRGLSRTHVPLVHRPISHKK